MNRRDFLKGLLGTVAVVVVGCKKDPKGVNEALECAKDAESEEGLILMSGAHVDHDPFSFHRDENWGNIEDLPDVSVVSGWRRYPAIEDSPNGITGPPVSVDTEEQWELDTGIWLVHESGGWKWSVWDDDGWIDGPLTENRADIYEEFVIPDGISVTGDYTLDPLIVVDDNWNAGF